MAILFGMAVIPPWAGIPGATKRRLLRLIDQAGDLVTAYCQRSAIRKLPGNDWIPDESTCMRVQSEIVRGVEKGYNVLSFLCPEYPLNLQHIPDAPAHIFYRGTLPSLESFAIVGSRKITPYGQAMTENIVHCLAPYFSIISGLAYGVDALAHKKTLAVSGKTYAVIAGSIDTIYPPTHETLANRIIEQGGGIISEYMSGVTREPFMFVQRNRIIAALSKGVVCVEGGKKSGARTTLQFALEYNKEVFAVPGSVFSEQSYTPNTYIKNGLAQLILGGEDILQSFGIVYTPKDDKKALTSLEKKVYEYISVSGVEIDALVSMISISPVEILPIISQLEQYGYIINNAGMLFRK